MDSSKSNKKTKTSGRGSMDEDSLKKLSTENSFGTKPKQTTALVDPNVDIISPEDDLNNTDNISREHFSNSSSPAFRNLKVSFTPVQRRGGRDSPEITPSPFITPTSPVKPKRKNSLGKVNDFMKRLVNKKSSEEELGEMSPENISKLMDPKRKNSITSDSTIISKSSSTSKPSTTKPSNSPSQPLRDRAATVGSVTRRPGAKPPLPIPSPKPQVENTIVESPNYTSRVVNIDLQAPPGSPKKSEEEILREKFKKRRIILDEIISTEETYIKSLQVAVNRYFQPLRSTVLGGTKFIVDGKPMNVENVNSIFNNIEMILQINEHEVLPKLKDLKEKWNDQDTGIGQVFIKWAGFFKLYAEYAQKYDKGIQYLKKAEKQCNAFRDWLNEKRVNPNTPDLLPALDQYIVTPVQRIPRYQLLLQQLLKNTPNEHKDKEPLTKAVELIGKLANDIDASIQAQENFQKIYSIQENFVKGQINDLIKPGRKFIKEGKVRAVKSSKDNSLKFEKFYLFLFNDIIVFSHPYKVGKVSVPGKYHYLRQVSTMQLSSSELILSPNPQFPFPFRIVTPERDYIVSTKTDEARHEWVKAINECREKELLQEGARMNLRVFPRRTSEMSRIALEAQKMEKIREIENERKRDDDKKKPIDEIQISKEVMKKLPTFAKLSANLTGSNHDIYSLLVQACKCDDIQFINYFFTEVKPYLSRDIQPVLQKGLTAAIKGGYKQSFKLLLDKGTDPNGVKDSVLTPLQLATELNLAEFSIELVQVYKSDINRTTLYSNLSPLQLAVRNQNFELSKFLLEAKASVDYQDLLNGRTALHLSVEAKNYEITQLLLEYGASLNIKDKLNGETPLHIAVKACNSRKDLMLLCLLLDADEKRPVDERALNSQKIGTLETPLHMSVMGGRERAGLVQLLLQYKPSLDLENAEGEKVNEVAEKRGFSKTLELINKARVSTEILQETLSLYLSSNKEFLTTPEKKNNNP